MIDPRLIRENPELVRKNLQKRDDPGKLKLLDDFINYDRMWRDCSYRLDSLRRKRNEMTQKIAQLKKEGKTAKKEIAAMKELPGKIKGLEAKTGDARERSQQALMRIPNLLHDSVPQGRGEEDNAVVRVWGRQPGFDFKPRGQTELGELLDVMDTERAAKIAGARFFYLKNELVVLHYAVLNLSLNHLMKKGYIPIQPPFMMQRKPYEGVTDLRDFGEMIYKIEGEDLFMIATSEHPMVAMYMNETLNLDDLPIKLAGISPCFRKEAGSHGRDTKGIFRVHQFDKVEQVVFCKPEDSWKIHEELMKNTEEIFQALELPYRVVNICTGEIGTIAAKKYDLEAWMPAQEKYREMASCSNATDYQARRLGIRYREKEGQAPKGFVHTLNNTGVASPRVLAALMENHQKKDGSIRIPKALWNYTYGMREIRPKK